MTKSNNELVKVTTAGRKYARKQTIEFSESPEGLAELRGYIESGGFGFHDSSIKFIEWIKSKLQSQGFDTTLPILEFRGKYLESAKAKFSEEKFTKADLYIKKDSISELFTDFILYCERAHSETLPTKHRLEAAFHAGDTYRKIKVFSEHGRDQSNIASKPRSKELDKIIEAIAIYSPNKNLTAKELWPKLVGDLDAKEYQKDLKLYCTFVNPDSKKETQKSLAFSTFEKKISQLRQRIF